MVCEHGFKFAVKDAEFLNLAEIFYGVHVFNQVEAFFCEVYAFTHVAEAEADGIAGVYFKSFVFVEKIINGVQKIIVCGLVGV